MSWWTNCWRLGTRCARLDVLLHGQEDVAERLDSLGVDLQRGDVRDAEARKTALEGVNAVVHLAAIVGDPACGRDPELSNAVNVEGTARHGRRRQAPPASSASCSPPPAPTTAAWPIRPCRSTRPASCARCRSTPSRRSRWSGPCSRATRTACPPPACASRPSTAWATACASTSRSTSSRATSGRSASSMSSVRPSGARTCTCATRRARWRSCWPRRARRSPGASSTPATRTRTTASSTWSRSSPGSSGAATCRTSAKTEDPRDYKVSFERIKDELGFEPLQRVPTGIEELVGALEEERFGDPFSPRYSNIG